MRIAFLPIDNRPVCYQLPKMIAQIDSEVEFYIPERKYLGDLKRTANIEALINWLKNLPPLDAIILSLDTIAYGGLIPSRRGNESFEEIKSRIENIKNILISKQAKIYAFSSIMRISNNNFNEEEKEYWSQYGKQIFQYSYNLHKFGNAKTDVPPKIIEDYLNTRKRNFEINKIYYEWQKEGMFETLVFSKDDCAQYGLNVKESQELEKFGAFTKTGADEIPLSLLSRALNKKIKICPIFLEPEYKNLISNYEDISIEKSVQGQIELCGCEITNYEDADIILYINNFKDKQGEIVMGINTKSFDGEIKIPNKPYMIADVRFANGADNNFVKELLKNKIDDKYFYGYSAWNTTANTLGGLICAAKFKYLAKNYNKENFEKLQITRFLDDWAYQANVRQMQNNPDAEQTKILMKPFEERIKDTFNYSGNIDYINPWERLFEVEIELN